jgi:uncharacterized protein (DUF1330 family)
VAARVALVVLLWARANAADALIAYEDRVLALVAEHGGDVHERARTDGTGGAPLEIHVIEFPSDEAFAAYMGDPRRQALADERDRAIERTEVHRVDLVPASDVGPGTP